jgi:dipeptidyl aminopeptidase/acylaminoacyl peptidase
MTTEARFERQLPTILEDLYMGPSPDYRDEVLAAATRTRQRPAWTFPGRWLPMADIATRPSIVPGLPWRAIGVALVIVALLAVAAFAIVGSRQKRLPPPFGPAGNGLLVYSSGGDIFTVDPRTGVINALITGPEEDTQPEYSPDGTKISFARLSATNCCMALDVVVAAADGTGARVISADHPVTNNDYSQWSPDSAAILVGTAQGSLLRLDATGTAAPVIVAEGLRFVGGEVRPPDGAQILYDPDSTPEIDLWIMNADGTGARLLIPASALAGSQQDLSAVRWSPDGKMIAFNCAAPANVDVSHLCVTNADGTNIRQLTDESDAWFQTDFAWSPDSTRIAFNRWYTDPATGTTTVRPIGVASITGGTVIETGPTPASDGALFSWSPDGTTLLSLPAQLLHSPSGAAPVRPLAIDIATGNAREVDWGVGGEASWQRVAR